MFFFFKHGFIVPQVFFYGLYGFLKALDRVWCIGFILGLDWREW